MMMNGWLVVNHFVNSAKFLEIFEWLEKAAKLQDINLKRKTNAELMCCLFEQHSDDILIDRPDFVLFWDKDIKLARYLESKGLRLFNSSKAIELCDDKSLTHLSLLNSGLKMPKTIVAPRTFFDIDYKEYLFVDNIISELGFPMVIKECFGSFGIQVYLANNYEELVEIANRIGTKTFLFQEFIASSKGRDIRINVVGDQVVAAMYRYSENGDFRANVTNGAKMKVYEPTHAQAKMAIDACKELKLDFAGVDILFGKNEEPILCEVNSNAHFKNIYDCTNINVADFTIEYIAKEMKV